MVLLQREQRQDQVGQEERRRKSPDGYVSVVLWNTTGSQCQSGTLGQQDNGRRKYSARLIVRKPEEVRVKELLSY